MSESNVQVLSGFKLSTAEPSGADFGDSPLRNFWLTGMGYEVRGGTSQRGNPWQRVYFRGNDIEVLETDGSAYPFPTAEISIFYSDPARTPKRREGAGTNDWEVLCESIRDFYGDKEDAIDDLWGGPVQGEGAQPGKPGKRFRMEKVMTLLRVPPNDSNKQYHDEQTLAWKVVEVEGMARLSGTAPASSSANGSTASASDGDALQAHVLNLADGKTEEAFYAAALDDSTVLATPSLVTPITERSFIASMVALNRLTKDSDGLLHKV